MDLPILSYFIADDEVRSTCDYITSKYDDAKIYYEVLRVINSVPLFIEDHIQRLFKSVELAGNRISIDEETIQKRIFALINYNILETGNIKFQFIQRKSNYYFTAFVVPSFYPGEETYNLGVKTLTIDETRTNPNQKIQNSELRKKTEEIKKSKGAFEILLTNNNYITEGSKSNMFFIANNTLLTPESKHVLPGITRHYVIECAKKLGIIFEEKKILLGDIANFNAAFLTGTSIKILPVYAINDTFFDVKNMVIKSLQNEYENMINTYISNFNT